MTHSIRPNRRSILALAAAAVIAPRIWARDAPTFRAGVAATDITPDPGIFIHGVLMRGKKSTGAHDRLHARSLALDDGSTILVLTICDVRMIGRRVCDEAKKIVTKKTGIPSANLLIAATHTHGTPTPVDLFTDEPYVRWEQQVIEKVAESMCSAVSKLAPAKLGYASLHKPNYTFCRRWKLKDSKDMPANPYGDKTDGVLTNPGYARQDKLLEPAGPVDDQVTILSLRHTDGRPLGLLANYSTHYVGDYTDGLVSSDYYGVFSEQVKQLLAPDDASFVAMMFNGTSGDVNTLNFAVPREPHEPWTRIERIGKDMASTVANAIQSINYDADRKLSSAVSELELGVRKPDEKRLEWARRICPDGKRVPGLPGMFASEAIELSKYPDRVSIPMQAFRIGSIGVAAMPTETFAKTGLEIKKNSPLQPTFNIGLANGYYGYLPTPEQHALGGYETWPARSSFLEVDASTKIRDTALKLLQKLSAGG